MSYDVFAPKEQLLDAIPPWLNPSHQTILLHIKAVHKYLLHLFVEKNMYCIIVHACRICKVEL